MAEQKPKNEGLIIDAKNFFDFYKKELGDSLRKATKVIYIDFMKLTEFSNNLSDELLSNPEETLSIMEIAVEELGLMSNVRIRLQNLPKTQEIKVRNIRSRNLNELIVIEGIIRQASDVRPQVVNSKFECPSCGTIISVLQIEKKFREPSRCSCGRKGGFKLISKEMVDTQRLVIEEAPESLSGGEQPKRINVFVKEDLVEPKMEEKTTPGSRIKVIGVLKEVPVPLHTGGLSTRFELAVEANNIIPLEETFEELDITEEDERQILELSQDPKIFENLTKSIAPSIWGYEEIKGSLVLQLFGGVKKIHADGQKSRGDIHILLIGDPGVAKSVSLNFIANIAPKGRYVVGKSTSLDYNEPLLIKVNNKQKFVKIGEFVDKSYHNNEEGFAPCKDNIESLSLNLDTLKLEWKAIKAVFRHKNNDKLLLFSLETGRKIKVTKEHSIFCIEKGEIICKPSSQLKPGDYVVIPKYIPTEEIDLQEEIARFLGYFIAEGNLYNKNSSYKIAFTLNKRETSIASEINSFSERYFQKSASIKNHGNNAIRVTIYGKEPYLKICSWLGDIAHKKAIFKGIPEIIINSNKNARQVFFNSYIKGDAGVTKSERLMSELLYLKLQDNIIASCLETKPNRIAVFKDGRKIIERGKRFDLLSPGLNKKFQNLRINFPLNCLPKDLKIFFKRKLKQNYKRINFERIDNKMLFKRIMRVYRKKVMKGKDIRKIFGENSLEYFSEHSDLFLKKKNGREISISLTDSGKNICRDMLKIKKLIESDVAFVKIKEIKEIDSEGDFVYDISIPENENFIAGFGGIVCHNSGAGLTATVVRDEYLRGWSLEAGAMVLANKGIVCLHPNSNIIFNNKIIPISELFDEKNSKEFISNSEKIQVSKINGKVQSLAEKDLQFKNRDATLIRRKKYNGKLLKINLDSGFSIAMTPEHKIIDGNTLQWKEAKDFQEQDFILAPLKINEFNKNLYLLDIIPDYWIVCLDKKEKQEIKSIILQKSSLKEFNKKYSLDKNYLSGGKQLKVSMFKQILKELNLYDSWKKRTFKYGRSKAGELLKISEITPELAYFIGFVLGDGSIKSTKKHSLIQITQSLKNFRQISQLKEFFKRFSYNTLKEYKRKSSSKIRGKVVSSESLLLYSNSNLLAYLAEFYIKNKLRNILNMPQDCLKAFIAGCMDSDGCISVKNCKKNNKKYSVNHIEFLLSNDSEINKNFILALRRLDCYSKFIEKKPISIIRLTGNMDVESLSREISGFSVKCKNLPKRKELISSASSKIPLEIVSELCKKIIQNCANKQQLNDLGISSVLYDYKNKARQPSREQLIKIREKLALPEEISNQIEILSRRDFFLDKIISIKKENYSGYIYDLFVPDAHNFVCEGIIVHNCIDELEKMDPQDRSAMHEAMEQQCYLPDFKLMLSNGKYVKIGKLIDDLMEKNKNKIQKGINCEILPVKNIELLSADFSSHFPAKCSNTSRHIAPEEFIKITLTNGKELTVTPEHPCWTTKEGKIFTLPAKKLNQNHYFPIPSKINIREKPYKKENDYLCKILGYHISDGSYELNRGKKTGIQFWNNNKALIEDYKKAIEKYFKKTPIITKRGNQFSIRVLSKEIAEKIKRLDKNLLEKNNIRKIPENIMQLPKENIKHLLKALYDGDGSVIFQKRGGCRVSFVSQNRELEEQISDLLLRFEIQSSIFEDKHSKVWRLDISGQENLAKFLLNINFLSEHKKQRLQKYYETQKTFRTIKDIIPNCTDKISEIFKKLGISMNKTIGHSIDLHVEKQRTFLQKLVLIAEGELKKKPDYNSEKYSKIKKELLEIKKLAFGYCRWMKIKKVEKIKNPGIKYVYDITVEPNHSFISNGLVLHNSVTISKANVQASLRAETSVLAAANPKFGRFDPYQSIAQQIDLAPTLINRFDVIFTLRDIPDKEKDEKIATHVLKEHQKEGEEMMIPRDLFRKYVAYAKQRLKPKLSDESVEEIKKFYIDLRNMPVASETALKPIPISARQLQALIRMSEASAKIRLSENVTREDAKRAIEIMKYYLTQVGYDYETKTFDIDKITLGRTASQRNKVFIVRDKITEMEEKMGKLIPIEEIKEELSGKLTEDEIEDALKELIKNSIIYEPKKGYVAKL